MNIYFAGPIRAGREHAATFAAILQELKKYGTVLTEHVGDHTLHPHGENIPENEIYQRDMQWLQSSDVVVAEVSTPSLGVGYEIAKAETLHKPILCLYKPSPDKKLSAMIVGSSQITVEQYQTVEEAKIHLKTFFNTYA